MAEVSPAEINRDATIPISKSLLRTGFVKCLVTSPYFLPEIFCRIVQLFLNPI